MGKKRTPKKRKKGNAKKQPVLPTSEATHTQTVAANSPSISTQPLETDAPFNAGRTVLRPSGNSLLKTLASGIGIVVTFVSLYTLLTSFVSIVPNDPLRLSPLSAPLTITNRSAVFTLTDVDPFCFGNEFVFANGITHIATMFGGYQPLIPTLPPGTVDTVYCFGDGPEFGWPGKFKRADVTIGVEYGLALELGGCTIRLPFVHKESTQRLVGALMSDGRLKWQPYGQQDFPVPPSHPKIVNPPEYEAFLHKDRGFCG